MNAENWFQLRIVGVTAIIEPGFGRASSSQEGSLNRGPRLSVTEVDRLRDNPAFWSTWVRSSRSSPSAMLEGRRKGKRLAWAAMYYLPLPWALYYTVVLIPIPVAEGWSLLYYQFPSRSYWITYAVLLGLFGVLPWTMGNPRERWMFRGWRDFFVHLFWGYAIALVVHLGWLLVLGMSGVLGALPLGGEDAAFAILTLLYVPPFWAPVIGALLQVRRGDGPLIRPTSTLRR